MAAVLACGDGAVLSHRSAAAPWGLRPDNRARSDVTSRGRAGRQRSGVVAHLGRGLMPADVTVVDGIPCSTITDSELERLLLAVCRTAGLPAPEVNVWVPVPRRAVQGRPSLATQRLIVETDGRDVHTTRQAFERDRERDQRLMLASWRVVRFTWRQLTREPERVAATLRALLAQADGP